MALPFQTRLTQTKSVLPLSNEHGSHVKDQGRRQCYRNKHKHFPIGLHNMYLYFPDKPRIFLLRFCVCIYTYILVIKNFYLANGVLMDSSNQYYFSAKSDIINFWGPQTSLQASHNIKFNNFNVPPTFLYLNKIMLKFSG